MDRVKGIVGFYVGLFPAFALAYGFCFAIYAGKRITLFFSLTDYFNLTVKGFGDFAIITAGISVGYSIYDLIFRQSYKIYDRDANFKKIRFWFVRCLYSTKYGHYGLSILFVVAFVLSLGIPLYDIYIQEITWRLPWLLAIMIFQCVFQFFSYFLASWLKKIRFLHLFVKDNPLVVIGLFCLISYFAQGADEGYEIRRTAGWPIKISSCAYQNDDEIKELKLLYVLDKGLLLRDYAAKDAPTIRFIPYDCLKQVIIDQEALNMWHTQELAKFKELSK